MPNSLRKHDLLSEQTELLDRIYKTINNGEFLQSYLLIGARHLITLNFIQVLAKGILCSNFPVICGTCKSCKLMETMQHPDFSYITNIESNTIKIDSVRDLQLYVYKSLSIAKYKLVVINPADKLNIQAASALLKILEEPPEHTIFILFSESINALPITIVSRCHKYYLRDFSLSYKSYFEISNYYPESDERFILMLNKEEFIGKLIDLTLNKINVCDIAAGLQEFKLENVLWFLYLLTAEVIKLITNKQQLAESKALVDFAKTQDLFSLYKQLDKLNICLKTNLVNITLNSPLAIENLLLGYK